MDHEELRRETPPATTRNLRQAVTETRGTSPSPPPPPPTTKKETTSSTIRSTFRSHPFPSAVQNRYCEYLMDARRYRAHRHRIEDIAAGGNGNGIGIGSKSEEPRGHRFGGRKKGSVEVSEDGSLSKASEISSPREAAPGEHNEESEKCVTIERLQLKSMTRTPEMDDDDDDGGGADETSRASGPPDELHDSNRDRSFDDDRGHGLRGQRAPPIRQLPNSRRINPRQREIARDIALENEAIYRRLIGQRSRYGRDVCDPSWQLHEERMSRISKFHHPWRRSATTASPAAVVRTKKFPSSLPPIVCEPNGKH